MAEKQNEFWQNFGDAFSKELSFDGTDWTQQRFHKRLGMGLDADEPRLTNMAAKWPIATRVRDLLGVSPLEGRESRRQMGMETEKTPTRQTAQVLGAAGADLIQDKTRSFWWLLNAMQAASNIATETIYGHVAPDLYVSDIIKSDNNKPNNQNLYQVHQEDVDLAVIQQERAHRDRLGFYDKGADAFNPFAGHSIHKDKNVQTVYDQYGGKVNLDGVMQKRRYPGGHVAALMIPQGIAVNTALGLMTPFGGATGYEAALPDPEDASKTSNVLGEIAAKYFLGRTGNLLPYHEFVKVRPDVSRSEYEAYKAFKYDKSADLDLRDGDFTIPTGVLKGTTEGIHGPEIQFLGRSLPLTTGVIPTASAILGGVVAAKRFRDPGLVAERKRRRQHINDNRKLPLEKRKPFDRKPTFSTLNEKPKHNLVAEMMKGSVGGLAAGMLGGYLLEAERQRRNMRENEQKTAALDPESTAIGF